MAVYLKKVFFFLLLVFPLAQGSCQIFKEEVVLSTHELPPLTFTSPTGEVRGESADRVRKALQSLGVPFRLQIRPWERAQREGLTGETSGFFMASENPQREEACRPSIPIAWQTQLWYLRKDVTLKPTDPGFSTALRFGGYHGANMTDYLKKNAYNLVFLPPNQEALIRGLELGRIDAFLGNEDTIKISMKNLGIPEGTFKTYPQSRKPLVVYFNKGFLSRNPGFLERFNRALNL